MEPTSSSSEKKSETEQIVFKGGNIQAEMMELSPNKKSVKKINTITIKKQGVDNLSFRTSDGKPKNNRCEPEFINERVSYLLKNNLIKNEGSDKKDNRDKEEDFKRLFAKKNEKELEVFESERVETNKSFSSRNNEDNTNQIEDDNSSRHSNNILSKVICTLSKIENGFATFVSTDDLIFVLPSLFIPSNLNVGNTYIFKLCEVDQAENKIAKVSAIHQIYSH